MTQQTAVDFIKEELERLGLLDKGEVMTNIFKQAKQIEKEQMIKFAMYTLEEITVIDWYSYEDFEEYYNKFNNPQNQIK